MICQRNNEINYSYSFLNVLNNVTYLDWEKSEFEVSPLAPQVILGVKKLALKPELIQDRHILRIEEQPILILVSEDLRQGIEESNLTGIEFLAIEQYKSLRFM